MRLNPQETADLVTFTAEILNEIQLKVFLEISLPENSWENILKEALLMQISKFLQIFFNPFMMEADII